MGLVFFLIILFEPDGIAGILARLRRVRSFALGRSAPIQSQAALICWSFMVRNGLSPAKPWSGCQAWRKHSTSFSTTGFGVAGLTFSTRWASLRERGRNPG